VDERRARIAGLEIVLRANRAGLLDELMAPWVGYASEGGEPDIVYEYEVGDPPGAQPASVEYPGFAASSTEDGRTRLERQDVGGFLRVPEHGPIEGFFRGSSGRYVVEAGLRAAVAAALPRRGGLLLHASSMAMAGRGFVFAGLSGAGKSTIARQLASEGRTQPMGDDMSAILPAANAWRAFATPFVGENGPVPDGSAPLERLCFLAKGPSHRLSQLPVPLAIPRILRNTLGFITERDAADRALAAAADLARSVPCSILEFARAPGLASVLGIRS
jgi:hypothetical protein